VPDESVQRYVVKQDRLNGLATLAIEFDLAKYLKSEDIISDVSAAKSRKGFCARIVLIFFLKLNITTK